MTSSENEALAQEIMAHKTDYYAVLQVPRDADAKQIRRSYHRLSLKLHPDKNLSTSEVMDSAFRVVNHCYEVLADAEKRNVYDSLGEEGLNRFDQFDGKLPSVFDLLRFIAVWFAYQVVRRCSQRNGCSELLDEIFPSLSAAYAEVRSEEDAEFLSQQQFAKRHAAEKRRGRRQLRVVFVSLSLILCFLTTVHRFVCPIFPSTFSGAETGDLSSVSPVDEAERLRQMQNDYLFPPSSKEKKAKKANPITVTVHGSCLALNDAREALCCQASRTEKRDVATCGKDAAASTIDNDFVVPLTRYGGSEADSIIAFHALVHETCEREAIFASASRDRFEETTSLHARSPLPIPRSPNKAPKRKYPERRWRPKFAESYTVMKESELFHRSPFCSKLAHFSA